MSRVDYTNLTMSKINLSSKCVQTPQDVKLYRTEAERVQNQIPTSTVAHNNVCARLCSRRRKITVQTDNMLDRKNKVRARLQKRLAEKKLKKQQKK